MTKKIVFEAMKALPDEFSIDDIMRRVIELIEQTEEENKEAPEIIDAAITKKIDKHKK